MLQEAFTDSFNDPTMEKSLVELEGISNKTLSILSEKSIKRLEELAEMSVSELLEIDSSMTENDASKLIMEARKPWFN